MAKMLQRQMQILDSPPETTTSWPVTTTRSSPNKARALRAGKILEQDQVLVMHLEGGKIAQIWLQFSDQQAIDKFASS